MARRQTAPALTPSHFKHFAVLTVAATACLALFANGESRNEIGQEVEQTQRQATTAVANAARKKAKPLMALGNKIHDARTTYVPLPGDDGYADMSYGRPMDPGGVGGGGGTYRPARSYTGGPPIAGQSNDAAEGQQRVVSAEDSPVAGSPGQAGSKPKKKQQPPTEEELELLEARSEARS